MNGTDFSCPIQCLPCMIDLVCKKKFAQYSHPISRVEEGNAALRLLFIVHVRTSVLARKCCLFRRSVARRHRHVLLACCHSQEPAFEVDNLSLPLKTPTSSHLISSTHPRHFSLVGQPHHEMARRPYHECSCHCVRWSKNQQNLVVVKPCHLP